MAPIDSLPAELLLYILHHALPPAPPSYSTFATRSRLLRSIALVSKSWREIAQAELLAHPLVHTAEQIAMLETSIDLKGATSFRTLRVGDGGRALHGGLAMELLQKATPKEVWLHTVNGLVLDDLAECDGLEELHCFKCTFVKPNTRRAPSIDQEPPPLASLRALHLDGCQFATYPTSLPRLKTLSLHIFDHPKIIAVAAQAKRLSDWVLGLAPQLLAFSFNPATYLHLRLMHHLNQLISLRFIDLSHAAFLSDRPQLLDGLPSSLHTLRITDSYLEADQLAAFIARSPTRPWRIIVVVGGALSDGVIRLMRLEGVTVKLELRRTREGEELITGERVARQEEWVDAGFWEAGNWNQVVWYTFS
ncbi:hypothetical protein BCR35DRAFT_355689 [Leucosporidium creatinivorum]|uniref:F-box domain-containing protein n=1 Tax=Leucosporidium creatinivorum TaxID=106004 RepID=A0A1Y2D9P3_9BASI|nr:hypothetical protein BCR35DRAFT_355689 [Leucosporidium creatinivorum]